MRKSLALAFALFLIDPIAACTIFLLTDSNQTLFFNNEDYTNPNTHMWFVPEGKGHYGCLFVGYDDGSAQGGLNTEGLAFDWYAGQPVEYEPADDLLPIEDNSSERMLEQCATVEEAIAFYKKYAEPGFAKASILIAEASGASVIIGARDGNLYFEKSSEAHVLGGQGKETFERLYTDQMPVTLESGSAILEQCVATGPGGTLYSNAYNLKTGEVYIFDFQQDKYVSLDLEKELEKGPHYYQIPEIKTEILKNPNPLLLNMERLILFDFEPLPDQDPTITTRVREIFSQGKDGQLLPGHFSERFWNSIEAEKQEILAEIKGLGELQSLNLLRKQPRDNGDTAYAYVIIFDRVRVLQQFLVDSDGKVDDLQTLSAYVTNRKSIESGSEKPGRTKGDLSAFWWVAITIFLGGTVAFFAFRRSAAAKLLRSVK